MPASTTQTIKLPRHARSALVRADTFSTDDNTVDLVFTTGADVLRCDYFDGNYIERLETGSDNVRLDRMNAGAAFLDTHNAYELGAVIGSVVPGSARMDAGQGLCKVQLSRSQRAADTVQDIRDGIINNISVGYNVYAFTRTEASDGSPALMVATDWEPVEISAVPVPADPGAQIRAATRSASGVELTACTITRAEAHNKEASMAHRNEPDASGDKENDKKPPAEAKQPEPKKEKSPEELAAEKAGLEPGKVKKIHDVPGGVAVVTEPGTKVEDPGDANPSLVQRMVAKAVAEERAHERARINDIHAMGKRYGLGSLATQHAETGTEVADFKDIILDKLAARYAEGGPQGAAHVSEPSLEKTSDKKDRASGEAWARKALGKPQPAAN